MLVRRIIRMLRRFIFAYKTINDIPNASLKKLHKPIKTEKRGEISIAVIDDQPFEAVKNLTSYGYNIKEVGDLKSVSEVAKFQIVLCDLMDVGAHFDKSAQGASIIKEIRKNYPAIYVLAYSGSASSDPIVRRAALHADAFIKKDAELEEWSDTLDDYISNVTDVREEWQRIRAALVDERLDTKDLLKLEDAYVRAYLTGDKKLEGMTAVAQKMQISSSARSIVEGLVTSTLFRLTVGV